MIWGRKTKYRVLRENHLKFPSFSTEMRYTSKPNSSTAPLIGTTLLKLYPTSGSPLTRRPNQSTRSSSTSRRKSFRRIFRSISTSTGRLIRRPLNGTITLQISRGKNLITIRTPGSLICLTRVRSPKSPRRRKVLINLPRARVRRRRASQARAKENLRKA